MKSIIIFSTIFILILTGCEKNSNKLILGKWKKVASDKLTEDNYCTAPLKL